MSSRGSGNGLASLRARLRSRLAKADPSTEPFLRAWLLGYGATTVPVLIKTCIQLVISKKRDVSQSLRKLLLALLTALSPRGLAFASGVAVGGAKWLEPRLEPWVRRQYSTRIEQWRAKGKGKAKVSEVTDEQADDEKRIALLTTFVSSTLSALVAIVILQSSPDYKRPPMMVVDEALSASVVIKPPTPYPSLVSPPATPVVHIPLAVKRQLLVPQSPTLDLTLFLLVRATDSLVRGAYESSSLAKAPKGSATRFIADNGDTIVFWLSCYRIMWCWFYLPHLLPPSYVKWITSLSRMDTRLLRLLQFAREGRFVYGTRASPEVELVCGGIAQRVGRPADDALPHAIPRLDCNFVHGFTGPGSCERNAIHRWFRAFLDCLYIYLPVHFVPQILFNFARVKGDPVNMLFRIMLAASRSAAFLATFVASIYASVCLMRTRLPQIAPSLISQQRLDAGLCTGLGCLMCGLSVLIENKRRRREMALYCAPRALYAIMDDIVPKVMCHGHRGLFMSKWAERVIFAVSTGVTLSATVHRPDLVSGVMHGIMSAAVGKWGGKAVAVQGRKRKHSLSGR